MTPEFPYVQLSGSYRGFFRKASLWEGVDHILSVSGSRFHEEYRRFYYGDIQAFIVEKTARAGSLGWWSILLALLVIATISTVEKESPYAWVALVVLSLLVAIRLEITFRRSCRCSIQTAVSRELLPSLMRRGATEAAIARLQIRIAAEQGELPEEIPASEDDVIAAVLPPDPTNPPASQVLEQATARERQQLATRGVNFAIAALFVLLLSSVFTFWASSSGTEPFSSKLWAQYLFIVIGLIPAAFSLQNLASLTALKGLRVLLIIMIVLGGLRLVIGSMMGPIQLGVARAGVTDIFVFRRNYANADGALLLAIAAGGLILIFAKWETYRRGEPSSN